MNNGWIKLHRKILDNPMHLKSEWFSLWIHMLLLASHDDHSFIWNGEKKELKKGEFVTGRKRLKELTGISETTIERILGYLEGQGKIGQQKTTKYRLITILNWEQYQNLDSKRTTDGQQTDTYKNYNKGKKGKKEQQPSAYAQEIVEIIDAFKPVNPFYGNWFGNITERASIERMLKVHGKARLIAVIAFLPKSNTLPFVPTITSPYTLEKKWADLEASLMKLKNKQAEGSPKLVI